MQPFHFLIQLEPLPGKEAEFRTELHTVSTPTRAEPGCLRMEIFESVTEPVRFAIHSVWIDEAAFDHHASQPHTVAFVAAAERLLSHPVRGLRTRAI